MEVDVILKIDEMVYHKVMHWVCRADFEVSGLGKVIVEDGALRVVDAMLLKQTGTGSSTELDPNDVARAMYVLRDAPGELKWWWHSHVKMDAFWSGTDRRTIVELAANGWICATVFNQSAEMLSAYAQVSPVPLFIGEVETELRTEFDPALIAGWDADFDRLVERRKIGVRKREDSSPTDRLGLSVYNTSDDDDDLPLFDKSRLGKSWSEEVSEIQAALARGELG